MRVHRSLKTVLSGLALASIVASSSRLLGDEVPTGFRSGEIPAAVRVKPTVSDIVLDGHGDFHGTIVDNLGLPQAGILVVARQGKEQPRTARTDGKGDFKLAGMKGGNWSVTAGSETSWVRAWNADLAPPAAKSNFLVVSRSMVVRGQSGDGSLLSALDAGTLFSVGAGVAGVTLGVIGISEASEANDQADSAQASANLANDEAAALRDQLNALSTTVNDQTTQLNALQMRVDDLEATLN